MYIFSNFKNTFSILITLTILILLIIPTSSSLKIQNNRNNNYYIATALSDDTIYVDDDGGADYTDIQSAINNAKDGDTIFIYNGQYTKFNANKQVQIIGESKNGVIIYANENKISADGVSLTTCTLKGKTLNLDCVLLIKAKNVDVSNCLLYTTNGEKPLYGINIEWSSYVTISNCEIQGFDYRGIQCRASKNIYIDSCVIYGSYFGIDIWSDNTKNIYIYNSELYNCGFDELIPGAAIRQEEKLMYICNCNIHDNERGVFIKCSSDNYLTRNTIYNNNIACEISNPYYDLGRRSEDNEFIINNFKSNNYGLYIGYDCLDNLAYQNNFENNDVEHAIDFANNNWYYESKGNYWDDYTGSDDNNDGIGDTPYYIDTYGYDNYPLINQVNVDNDPPSNPLISGPSNGVQNAPFSFTADAIDSNYDLIQYYFDWGDGSQEWFGAFGYNENCEASHIWNQPGIFNVKVMAKDIFNANSGWSNTLTIRISGNNPPQTPDISGPEDGVFGYEIEFQAQTFDIENDDIYYYINWDDGKNSGWLGPYQSGEPITVSHTWGEFLENPTDATFHPSIKAKDINGAESEFESTTIIIKNNNPSKPTIEASDTANTEEEYSIHASATDPDNHKVCFEIEWGDGCTLFTNVYVDPDEKTGIPKPTAYFNPGNYEIKVRACDYYGAKGPWEYHNVKIEEKSKNREYNLFNCFPLLYNLLKQFRLMGY